MTEEKHLRLKPHLLFARTTIFVAAIFLIATITAALFEVERLNAVCICMVNYLAYSWISFAMTILIALIAWIQTAVVCPREKTCSRDTFPNILLWVQAFGLVTGLVFLLIFITKFTNVL